MKKKIVGLAMTGVMVMTGLVAFGQANKSTTAGREDLKTTQENLNEAQQDSAADYYKFRKEAEMKIKDNELKIAVLKSRKAEATKTIQEDYNMRVAAVVKKNNALRTKIRISSHTKTDKWSSFKREFNHDMNELGLAIKDIGVDNKN